MMNNWKKNKLGEVVSWGNGKERPKDKGPIPVYGGNGVLDYTNQNNYEGETVIVGRVGAYCGSVYYTNESIWVSDNALAAKPKNGNDTKFLYYFLQYLNLNSYAEGSTHPLVTQGLLNSIDVVIPPLDEQKRIAGVLSSLDDKIDLLNRENATLEALAYTLLRHYFIENPDPTWKEGKLGEVCYYVTDKIDAAGLDRHSYISTENMLNEKKGVTDASSIPDNIRVTKYVVGDVLVSNIRPYFKKIWFADRNGGCSNDVLCIRAVNKEIESFVYYTLRQDDFFDYVMLGSKGCKMPRGDKQHIMNWPIQLPDKGKLEIFNRQVIPMIQKIKSNQQQIVVLANQRDTLLPCLMCGEVKLTE